MSIHRLKRKRLDLGLTIKQLANAVGVADSTVSNWESFKSVPHPRNLDPIARALGMTRPEVNDFFFSDRASSSAA